MNTFPSQTGSRTRSWCARCQFPGHGEFLFGSVPADSDEHARRELETAWNSICPYPVEILAVVPGVLIWQPDDPPET